MHILLTGMAGFIGFHTAKRLLAQTGVTVTGIDNLNDYYDPSLKLARLQKLGIDFNGDKVEDLNVCQSTSHPNCCFIKMDITNAEAIRNLFKANQFDYVIHLAAQAGVRYSLQNPHSYVDSNVSGFLNILEACRAFPVKHLVYASSSSVYGLNTKVPFEETDRVDQPASLYAATKKMNESMAYTYAHLYHIPSSGLRFFTVYGEWGRPDMSPFIFVKKILSGDKIPLFNHGKMQRDFTYVDDIVQGVIELLDKPPQNSPLAEIYNIGNNKPVALEDYIQVIEKATNKKASIEYLPMQPGDVYKTYANVDKLASLTGYAPNTPLAQGMERFVKWYREYYKV